MKRIILLLLLNLIPLAMMAQLPEPVKGVTRQAVEGWQFHYGTEWYSATVPGCIHTDLIAHDFIPDPHIGTNEDRSQWISNNTWEYRTTVVLDKKMRTKNRVDLVFEGLQTYADISINGVWKKRCNNMFRQWRVSIPVHSLKDEDYQITIDIRFLPTGPKDDSLLARLHFDVPDHRVFSRTAPYQQGWDWGPKLNSCGIWKPVYLEGWDSRENHAQTYEAPNRNSKLWRQYPFQDVRLRQHVDVIGQEFTFVANGKPIFAKGANWIPVHSFPILDSANKARYRHLLCSAKDANFNMIRVWGGGIYEPDYFYDLCDSLGLMVWTDFDYSCAFYPMDTAFLNNAKTEAEEQVKRLAKHPSVVLWCGNNEVKNGWEDWGWQNQYNWTEEERQKIQHGIDTLFGYNGILHTAVKTYAPWVSYFPSSPLYGWGHTECTTTGDSHYWGVWWGELPFEAYQEKTGRFMSEYGFMAYPQLSTIEAWSGSSFTQEDYSRNAAEVLDMPMMKTHQRHNRGVQIIDKALMQYYGTSCDQISIDDYVYLSQLCQAYGTGMGIIAHRVRQPHCMGTLYWQLNDVWPVASWSSIDYYGNWKALHYKARTLFADGPQILSERRTDSTYQFYLIDIPKAKHYYATLEYHTFDGQKQIIGNVEKTFRHQRDVNFDSLLWWASGKEVGLPKGINPRNGYLVTKLYIIGKKNEKELLADQIHFLTYPKNMNLPEAPIDIKVNKRKGGIYRITLTSTVLAKDVQLTPSQNVAGHFSDNYFDILPGEKKVVTFTADNYAGELTFRTKTLNETLHTK